MSQYSALENIKMYNKWTALPALKLKLFQSFKLQVKFIVEYIYVIIRIYLELWRHLLSIYSGIHLRIPMKPSEHTHTPTRITTHTAIKIFHFIQLKTENGKAIEQSFSRCLVYFFDCFCCFFFFFSFFLFYFSFCFSFTDLFIWSFDEWQSRSLPPPPPPALPVVTPNPPQSRPLLHPPQAACQPSLGPLIYTELTWS